MIRNVAGRKYVGHVGAAAIIDKHAVVDRDTGVLEQLDRGLDAYGHDRELTFDFPAALRHRALELSIALEANDLVMRDQVHALLAMDSGHQLTNLRTQDGLQRNIPR